MPAEPAPQGPLLDGPRKLTRRDALYLALLVGWTLASRLPCVSGFAEMSQDGARYVNSLKLDATYSVPMPGNIGFVLLAKGMQLCWPEPAHAYAAANILLGCLAAAFIYLLGTLLVSRGLAAAATLALSCNTLVWWHGTPLTSYNVWLAVLPGLAWFGLRFVRHGRSADLLWSTVVLGLGTVLRPDLVMFGGLLWAGFMLIGRARARDWFLTLAILAGCCLGWLLGTSALVGGVGEYLRRVSAQNAFCMEFSPAARGLFEGLGRNGAKYAIFLFWGAHLALVPFIPAAWSLVRAWRARWRALVLALLWAGPSWYFSFFVFMGNAGLVFPLLPLVYLGAARGMERLRAAGRERLPVALMLGVGLVSAVQFSCAPLLAETDQRRVILNVTFLKYTGTGLRRHYNHNLVEYGIDESLGSVLKQLRAPEPVPARPPQR